LRAREGLEVDRSRLLAVPVPARDDSRTEVELAQEWRAIFAKKLGFIYNDWLPTGVEPQDILQQLRIPYVAYWSFYERLPVVEEGTDDPQSISFAFDLLARLLRSRLDWHGALSLANQGAGGHRVFISYSHDSKEHAAKVLELAKRLRSDGIDAVLDQYEVSPPQGWPRWVQEQIRAARFVLVVCTKRYRRVMEGEEPREALGSPEAQVMRHALYEAAGINRKFIPIVLHEEDRKNIPTELQAFTYFPVNETRGYEALRSLLNGQPEFQKPALRHPVPTIPPDSSPSETASPGSSADALTPPKRNGARFAVLLAVASALLLVVGLISYRFITGSLSRATLVDQSTPAQPLSEVSGLTQLLILRGAEGYVSSVSFNNNAQLITAAGGRVYAWDWANGQELSQFNTKAPVTIAVGSEKTIFVGNGEGQIFNCNVSLSDCTATKTGTKSPITIVSANGNLVIAALSSGGFLVSEDGGKSWLLEAPLANGTSQASSRTAPSVVTRSIATSANLAAFGTTLGEIWIQKVPKAHFLSISTDSIATALSFNPDGTVLAAGTESGRVLLFDAAAGRPLNEFPKQDKSVTSVVFDPTGRYLAVSTLGPTIRVYSVALAAQVAAATGDWGPVYALSFSPDGSTLAAGCSDGTVRLWSFTGSAVRATPTSKTETGPSK
jgi:WD40 repeat protein